jgi:hypothetical protein
MKLYHLQENNRTGDHHAERDKPSLKGMLSLICGT